MMNNKVILKPGQIIAFPTETVYGLASKLYDDEAFKKIYLLKNRPIDKKIAVLFSSIDSITKIAYVDAKIKHVMRKYMPGPLTVVLKSKKKYMSFYEEDTIGVRIPDNEIALNTIKCNGPLKTTSVNISGATPMNDYASIVSKYYQAIDYIIKDDGTTKTNKSSTVIDYSKGMLSLLREGPIPFDDIIKTYEEMNNEN